MAEADHPLLVERHGAAVTLTWNRPRRLNAIDATGADALARALHAFENDDGVRCIVIRGAGDAFMAGGDITAMHRALPDARSTVQSIIDPFHEALSTLRRMPQVVVAAVHGHAAGAGASLAFATDLAVAADTAVFTVSYSKIGATPDGSATYTLPRLVGVRRAMELALLADPVPANRALELGLVNQVVAETELNAAVDRLVERICSGPRHAYAEIKQLIRDSWETPLAEQLQAERAAFTRMAGGKDFAEGVSAFLEKRRPDFTGH